MTTQCIHKINFEYIKNITHTQQQELLEQFTIDVDGNILIPFTSKEYNCMDNLKFKNSKTQAISLFSGAGGLDIGAQLANVKVLSSLDSFSDSVNTLKLNKYFQDCVHMNANILDIKAEAYSKILKDNNPEKLIIIGGPPCQPFSKAGYWITNEKRNSHEDPRNMLQPFFSVIKEIEPDGFILENVESILHPSNKTSLDSIYENIQNLGYQFSLLKINSADYGIPQKRKRVFFLASRKKIQANIKQTNGSNTDIIKDKTLLPYERVIDWIGNFDNEIYCQNEKLDISGKYEKELSCIPFGKNYIALSSRENHPEPKFIAGKRYWSSLLKLHPLQPSWTIIAAPGHWEGPFHWKNRRLNIKELAAIQTFPNDYKFYGNIRSQHKQIGNAVPPLLAEKIVTELCKWI